MEDIKEATKIYKQTARASVQRAINNGILEKQPCSICGNLMAEAHHEDYDKPLEVIWLCKKHHEEHHRILPTAPRRGRRSVPFEIIYRPGIRDSMDVIEYLLSLRANGENITQFITDAIREKMKGK